jgi:glutamate formiminotransferase
VLECVANLSEGRDAVLLHGFREAAAPQLLDLHADPGLNRCVLTMAGEPEELHATVAAVARLAVATLDIGRHTGAHPRLGVVDVVPFVDLEDPTLPATPRSLSARDRFAEWAAAELDLPCFLYGPERSLPEIRREAWRALAPDRGPDRPHPTAGATCVGARGALIAYNLVLATADLANARQAAAAVRRPGLRALAFLAGEGAMVSCNLTDPYRIGPAEAYDAVAAEVGRARIARAELVGLLPAGVLRGVPTARWTELGVGPDRTIEAALEGSHHQARPRSW